MVHQVRDLQLALDTQPCLWAYRLQALFYKAMRLAKTPQNFGKRAFSGASTSD